MERAAGTDQQSGPAEVAPSMYPTPLLKWSGSITRTHPNIQVERVAHLPRSRLEDVVVQRIGQQEGTNDLGRVRNESPPLGAGRRRAPDPADLKLEQGEHSHGVRIEVCRHV